jgi:hypothetical protein
MLLLLTIGTTIIITFFLFIVEVHLLHFFARLDLLQLHAVVLEELAVTQLLLVSIGIGTKTHLQRHCWLIIINHHRICLRVHISSLLLLHVQLLLLLLVLIKCFVVSLWKALELVLVNLLLLLFIAFCLTIIIVLLFIFVMKVLSILKESLLLSNHLFLCHSIVDFFVTSLFLFFACLSH